MKFRVYDKKEKKYSDKSFAVEPDGNLIYYCSLSDRYDNADPDRYEVEMSTGSDHFAGDTSTKSCSVKGRKNGYNGNFSAKVKRAIIYNNTEKRYEMEAVQIIVDESIENVFYEIEKYSLPFIPKNIKITGTIHDENK
jgi:hypothetical protein